MMYQFFFYFNVIVSHIGNEDKKKSKKQKQNLLREIVTKKNAFKLEFIIYLFIFPFPIPFQSFDLNYYCFFSFFLFCSSFFI